MNIYLAARYSRRLELCGYREQLRAMGHIVDAVWLNGEHQISNEGTPIGETGEALVEGSLRPGGEASERADRLRVKFAQDDYRDVMTCDLCISFTEAPRSDKGRGGRHVEFGIALGMMKRVWVVGHRENIFHWLEDVRFFETWEACVATLEATANPSAEASHAEDVHESTGKRRAT
jgi:hypothetical protein